MLGVAKGRQSVTLTAAATQLIDRVRFVDGQHVERGAVLVELKDTEQDAGTAQAQARVAVAQRAYERYRTLGEKGFASKSQIDQYESVYRAAQADVAAAKARQTRQACSLSRGCDATGPTSGCCSASRTGAT